MADDIKNSVLIFLEKVIFLNFKYLLLGFPSALESSQKQKSEKKWAQTPSKAPKISRFKNHVGVDASINNVVVNKITKPYK